MRSKVAIAAASAFILSSCVHTSPVGMSISLPENPTTGYVWTYSQEGEGKVALVDEKYERDGNLPGSGGMHTFVFLGEEPGELVIAFKNSRPWEEDSPADEKIFGLAVAEDLSVKIESQ